MFTLEELRNLAARASTIDERLAGGYVAKDTTTSAEKAVKRFKAWCKSATDGDEGLFKIRLARDGIDVDKTMPLLGDVRLAEDQPTPAWVETFCWAIEAMQSLCGDKASVQFVNSEQPLPFEDLFVSLVVVVRERRDRLIGDHSILLSKTAHAALQRGLLQRLSELCGPTLLEGFSIFKMIQQPMMMVLILPTGYPSSHSAYDAYIADLRGGGLQEYFLNRPVLARLLSTIIEQWIETTAELIIRLGTDLTEIYKKFHPSVSGSYTISDIDYGLSDPHNSGRTVCIITFSDGLKVVYKPKDMGIDTAWYNFMCWLDAQEAPKSVKAPKVLQRQGYGWGEYIEPSPCINEADANQFFQSVNKWGQT